MKMILGSSSTGRKMVMQELGYDFEVMSPDIDEKSIRNDSPKKLVLAIANAKADALLKKINKPVILITSDQVIVFEGKVREKPINKDEARDFLRGYRDVPIETIGAVVVVNAKTGKRAQGLQQSRIHFNTFPESLITKYLDESNEALTGAGGFVIQNPIFKTYIKKIEGSFDSAVGLSKNLLNQLLKEVEHADI